MHGFATRPISVNRQSTGDVIYDYMSECGETAWGSPGTCICKRENESFYEVKEGRLCSRLSQIISHESKKNYIFKTICCFLISTSMFWSKV